MCTRPACSSTYSFVDLRKECRFCPKYNGKPLENFISSGVIGIILCWQIGQTEGKNTGGREIN